MSTRLENPLLMVGELKGAQLSVICVMLLANRMRLEPVNQEFVERYANLTDKPASKALKLLHEKGLILPSPGPRPGWLLAKGVLQLPLMNLELENSTGNNLPVPSTCFDRPEPVADGQGVSRRISESETLRLSSGSGFNQNLDLKDSLPQPDSRAGESEILRLKLAALDQGGIEEPRRSKIARMQGVSVELIQYHCATAGNTGQAIYRIEHGWRIKTGWRQPELAEAPTVGEEETEDDPLEVEEAIDPTWEQVLGCLAQEMDRANYLTWVKPLIPLGFDQQGEVFSLRAMNPYARDWVESRLTKTIGRMISGLSGKEVRVEISL